ncbi:MAG TPA: hypothetical protein EYO84_04025 [Planctomycetes bacterium]|nr:hypothetical protein [Planctomycetota bacterium]
MSVIGEEDFLCHHGWRLTFTPGLAQEQSVFLGKGIGQHLIAGERLQFNQLTGLVADKTIALQSGGVPILLEGDEEVIDVLVPHENDERLTSKRRNSPHRLDPGFLSVVNLGEVERFIVLGQAESWKLPLFPDHQRPFSRTFQESRHLHDMFLGRIDLLVAEALDSISDGTHRLLSTDCFDVPCDHLESRRITGRDSEVTAAEHIVDRDRILLGFLFGFLFGFAVWFGHRSRILYHRERVRILGRETPAEDSQQCHAQERFFDERSRFHQLVSFQRALLGPTSLPITMAGPSDAGVPSDDRAAGTNQTGETPHSQVPEQGKNSESPTVSG